MPDTTGADSEVRNIVGVEYRNTLGPHLGHKFFAVFHKKITVYLEVFHS